MFGGHQVAAGLAPKPSNQKTVKRDKSMLGEAKRIERAVELIQLGARLQVLEVETPMSYERLLHLYKEVAGKSPPKGQLPFSVDWFMTWKENVHASLFANIHAYIGKASDMDDVDVLIKSYRLYMQQAQACGLEVVLTLTRAWRLTKFLENNMLETNTCIKCGGSFITHLYENHKHYVCGLCQPPARAGGTATSFPSALARTQKTNEFASH